MNDFEIKDGTLIKYKGKDSNVVIPDSVKSIGENAFLGSSLKSIEIPSGVTSIGRGAFNRCYSLQSISIPSSVTSIGECVFWGCESLTSVEIPSSVTSIGTWAFGYCKSLQSIEVAKDNPKYYSENNCIIEKESKTLIAGCNTSTIPEGVKAIGEWALNRCYSLKSITIPSSVTSIGRVAFSGCESLKSIEIPSSVTSIGEDAFWGCGSLNKITLPSRFKGQESKKLSIRKECEITYTDDDDEIIYSKN